VTQGRRATEYLTIPVYSGSQLAITSSGDQYPFYLYTWDNVSGSGTAYVDLPDTSDLDGVEYQFQLSSSFTSGKSITLVPSGSQIIDGAANTTLTIPGSLYQFKAVSGSWITTLAPATAGTIEVQQGDITVNPVNNITFTGAGVTVSGSGTTAFVNIPSSGGGSGSDFPYTGSAEITGSLSVTGSFTQSTGYTILTTVSSSYNYVDDTAAASGGIPLGGLYRNGNAIMIRLT
jgi:hypothetical protein